MKTHLAAALLLTLALSACGPGGLQAGASTPASPILSSATPRRTWRPAPSPARAASTSAARAT
ncbi:hypothetical protein ACFQY5_26300 [Paeniroseomonas aquatica]|uniref:hypothetical protein n=1 Tax=Paeniroseomonas aquatica TaxID=373043 RepID=UPI0036158DD1